MSERMKKFVVLAVVLNTLCMMSMVFFMFVIASLIGDVHNRLDWLSDNIERNAKDISESIKGLNSIEIETDFPIDVEVR
jgi:hypothetical protein